MTKENREKAYLHFRNQEKNYTAGEGKNHGLTATSAVRKHCKELADDLLKRRPELVKLDDFNTYEEYQKYLKEEAKKKAKAEAEAKKKAEAEEKPKPSKPSSKPKGS